MSDREARDGLPRVALRDDDDDMLAALRGIQVLLLEHPVASQAACSALRAEGQRFKQTPEGRAWQKRLERSELLHHARLIWKMASLSLLEDDAPERLPSAYLDALFLAAAKGDPDPVLDRLFGGPGSHGGDADAPR